MGIQFNSIQFILTQILTNVSRYKWFKNNLFGRVELSILDSVIIDGGIRDVVSSRVPLRDRGKKKKGERKGKNTLKL